MKPKRPLTRQQRTILGAIRQYGHCVHPDKSVFVNAPGGRRIGHFKALESLVKRELAQPSIRCHECYELAPEGVEYFEKRTVEEV